MGTILALLPIVVELLKILFGGASKEDKAKALEQARVQLSEIRSAIEKSQETEGDTSDLEDIVNKRG